MLSPRVLGVLSVVAALGAAGCDSDSDTGASGEGSTSTTSAGSEGPTGASASASGTPTTATASETATSTSTSTGGSSDSATTDGESSSSTGGEPGATPCQPQMSKVGIDRWRLGAEDRMPTFAEIALPLLNLTSSHQAVGGLSGQPNPQGGGFLIDPDGGGVDVECSVWDQDCSDGEKCAAWANDGSSSWNATRCVPVDDSPVGVGETCTVESSGVSGIDNCDATSMCFSVDNETNEGTCVALCEGSENAPTCAPEATACSISNDGVLILCLPICNPLANECDAGQGCFPVDGTFQCVQVAGGVDVGEPCEFINACADGTACVNPDIVPGCPAGAGGCCTSYCGLDDDTVCLEGQECVPWFEMGQEPDACLEGVGICSTP